jgi:hypothetical protein
MKNLRIFWFGFCAVLVICAVVGGYLVYPRQAVDAKANNMVGSWDIMASIPQGTFHALISMTSDGIILADEIPAAFETTAHGNWISSGHNKASYTFLFIVGDNTQTEILKSKVVGIFEYDPKTDSISGPFKVTQVDPQGNIAFTADGTFTGTRITVEQLK